MKTYSKRSFSVFTLTLMFVSVLATLPNVEITVETDIKENSTTPVYCNFLNETSNIFKAWFRIENEGMGFQRFYPNKGTTFVTLSDKIWTRDYNGKQIGCCKFQESKQLIHCSNNRTLNILFPPSYVYLEEVPNEDKEDISSDLALQCTTDASNPSPELAWIGLTSTMTTQIHTNHSYDNITNSYVVTEIMYMNLSRQDIGLTVYCKVAINSIWSEDNLMSPYTINVTLTPNVTITGGRVQTVDSGSNVTVRCHVDSYPMQHVAWYHTTDFIVDSNETGFLDLDLFNVTMNENASSYTCTGDNGVGIGISRSVTLIVQDIRSVAKDEHFLSFLGVGPVIGSIIIAVIVIVIISILVIFVQCRKKHKKKSRQNNDRGIDHHDVDIEEPNTVTIDNNSVIYAMVNKPTRAPVAEAEGDNVLAVTPNSDEHTEHRVSSVAAEGRCYENVDNEELGSLVEKNMVPTPYTADSDDEDEKHDDENEQPTSKPNTLAYAEVEFPRCPEDTTRFIGKDRTIYSSVAFVNTPGDDHGDEKTEHRVSSVAAEGRCHENVDKEELGSLVEKNMVPPPYTADSDDEDEKHDDENEQPTSKPNTLAYAEVEFPRCPEDTTRFIGKDRTIYSSVAFVNTPGDDHGDEKTEHRVSSVAAEGRCHENVDKEELGSLVEKNMNPPPYTADSDDEDEKHDDENEQPTSKPNTLAYAEVEFPRCPEDTPRITGKDRTTYSSVAFVNTPGDDHGDEKTYDEYF